MELVTIATSGEVSEAEFLRNHLEEAGFEVYLADDNIIGAYAFLAPAVGWIKIKDPSDAAEKAAEYVGMLRSAEIVYDENFPDTENEN